MGAFTHTELAAVEQPQGAALMTTRNAFEQVGYLDTTFPMFFSDVDWCRRFFDCGFQIIFYPDAQVVHQKGSSIYRNREKMIWSSHRSFIHYFQKYDRGPVNSFLNLLVAMALLTTAGIRIFLVTILKLYKKQRSA
jgi:GT2 family glycosyltransferase